MPNSTLGTVAPIASGTASGIGLANGGAGTTLGSYGGALSEGFNAVGAYNNPNLSDQQKAYQLEKAGVLGVADFYAAGLPTLIDNFAKAHWGGTVGKIDNAIAYGDPISTQVALASKFLGVSLPGGSGKDIAQKSRDSVRSFLQKNNLLDSNFQVKLADGTLADMGMDGSSGKRQATNLNQLVKGAGAEMHPYDTDYTNDMDFFSGMGGIALSRLLTGTDATSIKQVGSQLGNAALGKVGYGAKMTQDNFNNVMGNLKGMYSQAGITSLNEANALANKMFAAGTINASDLSQMQQSFNMVFNNDFNLANKLSAGRQVGVQLAANSTGTTPTVNTSAAIHPLGTSSQAPVQTLPYKTSVMPNSTTGLSGITGQPQTKAQAIAQNSGQPWNGEA